MVSLTPPPSLDILKVLSPVVTQTLLRIIKDKVVFDEKCRFLTAQGLNISDTEMASYVRTYYHSYLQYSYHDYTYEIKLKRIQIANFGSTLDLSATLIWPTGPTIINILEGCVFYLRTTFPKAYLMLLWRKHIL